MRPALTYIQLTYQIIYLGFSESWRWCRARDIVHAISAGPTPLTTTAQRARAKVGTPSRRDKKHGRINWWLSIVTADGWVPRVKSRLTLQLWAEGQHWPSALLTLVNHSESLSESNNMLSIACILRQSTINSEFLRMCSLMPHVITGTFVSTDKIYLDLIDTWQSRYFVLPSTYPEIVLYVVPDTNLNFGNK